MYCLTIDNTFNVFVNNSNNSNQRNNYTILDKTFNRSQHLCYYKIIKIYCYFFVVLQCISII